ncbi:thiamine pyrophosphate-binding protein [Photobacterium sp. GJ3]|uniref:thiamine pyrophosphate-binding protein n=1 Tax=Photobacterium sp. GJ3 TaxID=2829502 RepID=UPI001B8CA82E|nr:thiamine pyrophosphate-binding protein [Photobacterium sp. GJ3]QUJ68016.1 thiamine pyrophosphate-binding protein [Photobacterium sp. GJ3]
MQDDPTTMPVARYVLKAIQANGVDHVFMVPGGVVDPFLNQFGTGGEDVKAIVAASETGAAYMADGYARASGRFGVCMGIGGPGMANMIGPLATAYTDESPVLALAGEIPTAWNGRGGFQDASEAGLNDISMLSPVTEMAMKAPEADMVPHLLDRAFRTMLGQSLRPVSLSFPKEIQTQTLNGQQHPVPVLHDAARTPRAFDLSGAEQLCQGLIQASERGKANVSILVGSGAIRSEATQALITFAETYQIPVATTLKAKGVFPETHPLSLGVFGYSGTQHATLALLHQHASVSGQSEIADNQLLLVFGSSLNQRDTMRWDRALTPEAGIYQVDLDIGVFDKNFPVEVPIQGDVSAVLDWLLKPEQAERLQPLQAMNAQRQAWLCTIQETPRFYEPEDLRSQAVPMNPARVIAELQRIAPKDTVMIGDSGAHRAFAGHYWQCEGPRQYLTATALAPMGWAIPAGVGAKVANPDHPCVVITGDGCMLMNGIEIQTAARHQLPLVVLVINNSALGNVYLRAATDNAKALTTLATHDWAAFSRALGGEGIVVEHPEDLAKAFDLAFTAKGPFVIDARCDPNIQTPVNPWRQELAHPNWSES